MKYGAVARILVLGCALAACAPSVNNKARLDVLLGETQHAPKTIAPVAQPVVRPWKVGQWAMYSTDGHGYQLIAAVAEDACGMWFSTALVSEQRTVEWTICMRPPQVGSTAATDWVKGVIVDDDDGPHLVKVSALHDADAFAAVVADLFPATWTGVTSQREEVDVGAGHFVGAIRTEEPGGTRWTHPDVPFMATVRFRTTDGHEFALVRYGEERGGSFVKSITRGDRRQRHEPLASMFFELALPAGYLTGHGAEKGIDAMGFEGVTGIRVVPQLDLAIANTYLGLSRDPSITTMSRDVDMFAIGVRWFPFATDWLKHGRQALYIRAGAGYATLGNGDEDLASGVVGDVGLGWRPLFGRDWSFVLELGDRILWLNSDYGVRHDLGANLGLHVNL